MRDEKSFSLSYITNQSQTVNEIQDIVQYQKHEGGEQHTENN